MDISVFGEYVMVCKYGNLSEASRELNVSQPALSRHLSQLEQFAGTALFDRSKTPMELTYAGEVFLKRCSEIYSNYAKLEAFARKTMASKIDEVRIAGICGLLNADIASKLRAAKKLVEQNDSHLFVKFSTSVLQTPFDMLRSGELDIAIEPMSTMIDTYNLDSMPIAKEKPYVVVEEGNQRSGREFFDERDLDEIRFVTPKNNASHALRKHLQSICSKTGPKDTLPKAMAIVNVNAYDELFLNGLDGYAVLLPESIAHSFTTPPNSGYVAIPLAVEEADYDIRAFFRKNPTLPTQTYLAALEETLG